MSTNQCDQQNKIFIDNFIDKLVKNGLFDYLKNEHKKIIILKQKELDEKYKKIIINKFLYDIKMQSDECWNYLTENILNTQNLSEQHSKKKYLNNVHELDQDLKKYIVI